MRSAELSGVTSTGGVWSGFETRQTDATLPASRSARRISPVTLAVGATALTAAILFILSDLMRSLYEAHLLASVAAFDDGAIWSGVAERAIAALVVALIATALAFRRRAVLPQLQFVEIFGTSELIEAMPVGIALWNERAELVTCNDRFSRRLGRSDPEATNTYHDAIALLLDGGRLQPVRESDSNRIIELHRPDGACLMVDERPLAGGGFITLVADITEHKRTDMIVLDGSSAEIVFEGIASRPVPSLFRGFSAPVKLRSPLSQDDQLFLAQHDADPFNRWQSLQDVAMVLLTSAVRGTPWPEEAIGKLAAALEDTLASDTLDDAFKANVLVLPTESDIARELAANVDPSRIHELRDQFLAAVVGLIEGKLRAAYEALASNEPYSPNAKPAGRRDLRNRILGLLVRGKGDGKALAARQYADATNMTDRLAALSSAVIAGTPESAGMLEDFRIRFTADPLVLDKWLSLSALPPQDGTLDRVRAIIASPDFPQNNPNRIRSLVGGFANGNPVQFARADGAGFRFITEFVADVDKRNPQVAARLLTAFKSWKNYEPGRRAAAEAALKTLRESTPLSRNAADILARTLDG